MSNFHEVMRGGCKVGLRSGSFLGQHMNPVRSARRAAVKAAGGIRQFKRAQCAK